MKKNKKVIYHLAFQSPEGENEIVSFDREENLLLAIWAFMDVREVFNGKNWEVPMALAYEEV